jgi:hypothetical protein
VIDIDRRIGSIVLILMAITIVLVAFNIYATLELADEAAELKEVLLAG